MNSPDTDPETLRHTTLDDVQGLSLGIFLCGLGIHFLTTAGLMTGQTAGIAVILSYAMGWSFGVTFFVINLPFYVLAYRRLGVEFTVKSLISVTLLSALSELLPLGITIDALHPGLAAVAFGACAGIGLLAMFRHNGSMGGMGVVALLVQDTTGFRAGYVQLLADAVIFALAALIFPLEAILWSLLGAVILNLTIAVNHRRDRYIAT
ncbi:YitT family protein [Ponticoccus sp. SC2-23]|uniref:YitT family protein n=1 Tax=Alexandriicola marinus TaxID=2081710 RepID=UPI000FDA5FEC|nr:YitT family protein [Alexandriicola marinus]MBM1219052.1 YitT family protein [Ponticoccus sp. SC6-9]MBM1223876.1 YitT family protein [Ponticoccus sp. SC6-15]MBM1228866.1 YitT family protein [Ponticoccus sp. SC6-38]MBM1232842.1 YitT family protein [Ponticoccus sp. SC6-45]MBM1237208.1 YitT family protein [Ponticoccus sp. SC6-49]MBM1241853.1 YitT family protein [Ponticoccus sp. SC2-64]MBM1246366.1 YitT family protein [Ponticoccus sp. SC6-42]MBM1250844.1 YitT family protein [Ponticoccus sp. 